MELIDIVDENNQITGNSWDADNFDKEINQLKDIRKQILGE